MKTRFLTALFTVAIASNSYASEGCKITPSAEDFKIQPIAYIPIEAEGNPLPGKIPVAHLNAFTSTFLENFYKFTPETAQANANAALRLMSPRLKGLEEQSKISLAKQSKEQEVSQAFRRETPFTYEQHANGYSVSFETCRYRTTLNTIFSRQRYRVQVLLTPVNPSNGFEWAVVADDLQVQEITQ